MNMLRFKTLFTTRGNHTVLYSTGTISHFRVSRVRAACIVYRPPPSFYRYRYHPRQPGTFGCFFSSTTSLSSRRFAVRSQAPGPRCGISRPQRAQRATCALARGSQVQDIVEPQTAVQSQDMPRDTRLVLTRGRATHTRKTDRTDGSYKLTGLSIHIRWFRPSSL